MTEEGDGTVPIVGIIEESNNLSNAEHQHIYTPEHLQQTSGSSSQPSASRQQQNDRQEAKLKYGAEQVIELFISVSLCMMVVVVTINTVNFYTKKDVYLVYTSFHETSYDIFTKTWNSVANSMILITFVIFCTILFALLYKYKFYKVINVYLIISSLMFLFWYDCLFFGELLRAFNIPTDIVTIVLFNLNFAVLGIMVIHWKGPLRIQQGYFIFIAVLAALFLIKRLPEWTTWAVLFGISVWDVVAVLTPQGPLRILVETAQERNETIFPSLIYATEGVKLGLGDFVFYSVLVGKASSYGDWNTTIACFIAILVGLCFTMLLLATYRRVLPALPISVSFGLVFYFVTRGIGKPFSDMLTSNQVFI